MNDPQHEIRVGYSFGQMLLALLGGAAAGATVAFLTAPRAGAETRARLRSMADDAKGVATRVPLALRDATEAAQRAFSETIAEGADSKHRA